MDLNIRPRRECLFDAISLGEIMLRLDPGEGRIKTTRSFKAFEGGGEYNVVRGLRRCFGYNTAVLTALANNEIGKLIEDLVLQGGVDTRFIKWVEYDGVGRNARNGLNFTERGFGFRHALGVSDRAYTAVSQLSPYDFDLDYIFGVLGVRWLHTGGVFAGLSEQTAETAIAVMQAAKRHGTIVSYDVNYRPSLWRGIGGIEKAREVNLEMAKYIDVMIDYNAFVGLGILGHTPDLTLYNEELYKDLFAQTMEKFPNFKVITTTFRNVKTATNNDWYAICYADGKVVDSNHYESLEIVDRVGGGDSFASGLIYGLMETGDIQVAVNYGIAHGVLAMTTPGDTSMACKNEVEKLMSGGSARVER